MRAPALGCLIAALTAAAWPTAAQALSIGRLRATPVLGQPLDVALPVALEEGEAFGPECVAVDLQHGELKVHPDQVQVRIEPGPDANSRVVRIRTPFALFEPLVTVAYSLGCTARVQRQLVLFVDPPDGLGTSTASAPVPLAAPLEPRSDAASGGVIKRTGDLSDRSASAAGMASSALPRSPRWRADSPDLRALRRPLRSVSAAPAEASRDGGAVTAPAAPQPAAPQPRLKLDAGTVATSAASPAAGAASAPSPPLRGSVPSTAPAPGATAASQPLSLEQQLASLQQATQAQSETLARLQAQLESQADLQRTRQVLQILVGVMAVLVLLLGWKLWQVNPRRTPANAWMQPDELPPAGKA